MKSLLHNPFFWCGEIGLLIVIISCLAIIEIVKPTASRWYVFALYAVAVSGVWSLGQPVISTSSLPHSAYVFRSALGYLFIIGYRQLNASSNYPLSQSAARTIHRIFIFGGVVSLFALLSIGIVIMVKDQKEIAEKLLEDQINEHRESIRIIKADTTIALGLRTSLDSTNKLLRTMEKQRAAAAALAVKERMALSKRAKKIERNTDTLKTKLDEIVPEKPAKGAKKNIFQRIFGGSARAHLPDSLGAVASHRGLH